MDRIYSMISSFVYGMDSFFVEIDYMCFEITRKFLDMVQGCLGSKFFVTEFVHILCVACKLNIVCTFTIIQTEFSGTKNTLFWSRKDLRFFFKIM